MDDEEGCTVCGSNILHEEDGRTLCQNGHDQGRGPITAEDDGDFVRQGTIVRKKVKKEKQKITKGGSTHFHAIPQLQVHQEIWIHYTDRG